MPNAKVLSQKQAMVTELAEKMKNASAGVFVDYKGITVEADTKLRRDLRAAGVEYMVIKNTLTRFAANQIGFDALDPILNGTTALAISMTDSMAPSKLIGEFAKKNEKVFKIKAGFIDGQLVDVKTVMALSELPSKEVLLATVLGTMIAPISAFARTINAIAEKQSAGATEAAPEVVEAAPEVAEAAPAEETAPEATPEA